MVNPLKLQYKFHDLQQAELFASWVMRMDAKGLTLHESSLELIASKWDKLPPPPPQPPSDGTYREIPQ